MCWSRGFKIGKTGPGSEGEQVFITEGWGGGECTQEREQLVQRLVTGRHSCQGKGKADKRTSPVRVIWEGWGQWVLQEFVPRTCSGFGLHLRQYLKLSKAISRGNTHSCLHFEAIPLAIAGVLNWRGEDAERWGQKQLVWKWWKQALGWEQKTK